MSYYCLFKRFNIKPGTKKIKSGFLNNELMVKLRINFRTL
jgi:hypothetical protein